MAVGVTLTLGVALGVLVGVTEGVALTLGVLVGVTVMDIEGVTEMLGVNVGVKEGVTLIEGVILATGSKLLDSKRTCMEPPLPLLAIRKLPALFVLYKAIDTVLLVYCP